MQPAYQEPVFFNCGNVFVTRSRIQLGGMTYAVNGVSSVHTGVERKSTKPLRSGIAWVVAATFLGLAGFWTIAAIAGFVAALLIGAYVWLMHDRHTLVVNGREVVRSPSREYVAGIECAIHNALASRW
jgi:hypothetical protein